MTSTARIDDMCDLINGGTWSENEYANQGIPVVRVSDMKDGSIDTSNQKFLSETCLDRYARHELKQFDLVIATVGSHPSQKASAAGRATLIPSHAQGMLLNQNAVCIRTKSGELDQRFLGFIGQSEQFQAHIANSGRGAASQMRIPLSAIRAYSISLPPKATQQRVVSIISAYDELIDNNRRRITLLEEVARMLYREWFVHLRFPSHEHVKIVDGLPEGWQRLRASDVMEVLSGGTPKTDNSSYWGGGIGFFTPRDATGTPFVLETEKTVTEEGLKACNSRLYGVDTVFITARGTVGKLNLAMAPMAMNQSCYALQSKTHVSQIFLYLALKEAIEEFRSRATGAVFDAIIVATFDRIPFVLPAEREVLRFTDYVTPMFDQIRNLSQQNHGLVQARNLLLPRLINGEIAV